MLQYKIVYKQKHRKMAYICFTLTKTWTRVCRAVGCALLYCTTALLYCIILNRISRFSAYLIARFFAMFQAFFYGGSSCVLWPDTSIFLILLVTGIVDSRSQLCIVSAAEFHGMSSLCNATESQNHIKHTRY